MTDAQTIGPSPRPSPPISGEREKTPSFPGEREKTPSFPGEREKTPSPAWAGEGWGEGRAVTQLGNAEYA